MNRFWEKLKTSNAARGAYWKNIRGPSLIIFYAGVFSLFCCFGFVSMLTQTKQLPPVEILLFMLCAGGFAVGYAALAIRRKYVYMLVIGVAQGGVFALLGRIYPDATELVKPNSALHHQLTLLGTGASIALVLGYISLVVFVSREGVRYFRAQTEVELAAEIHRALVPVIHKIIGSFEIYGSSLPSGRVGGDLVDVAENGDMWMGYVADVSGHGVSSGVLMAMFKTAVRARFVADPSSAILLEKINRTLLPLKMPNMYVTAAFLECRDGEKLFASLAGHPPLLHYCKGSSTVTELPAQGAVLGVFPSVSFTADPLVHAPGDIFVLLTDGITEVFDAKGNELGLSPIKSALCRHANQPLPELFESLRQVALNFGGQQDDQTMLLVRQVG